MSRLLRRTLVGVALGALLYVVAVVWFDARALADTLAEFAWWAVGAALGLSCLNYALRFGKWELCLRWLRVRGEGPDDAPDLTLSRSAAIYIAGLSMSVTPGKVGEVLRSGLLKSSDGVSFARTAPIVVADRVTDLLSLVILTLVGIAQFTDYLPHVGAAFVLVVAVTVVFGSPKLFGGLLSFGERLPVVGGLASKAHAMVDSSAALLRPGRLLVLTAIGVVGWGLECVGYWLILRGFAGVDASLQLCTFLWSATTIVGALSFLPGGLGATEGSLAILVARFARGVTEPIALASTLLIRVCTLWWGVALGSVVLAFLMRSPRLREHGVDLDEKVE